MATVFGMPGLGSPDPRPGAGVSVVPVPADLRLAAAARLLGEQTPDPLAAAQRFLESAPELGIDLDRMWCVLDTPARGRSPIIRNVCLAVLGTGRTAMLFVSGPARRGLRTSLLGAKPAALDHAERVAVILHACEGVAGGVGSAPGARLAQSLLEPKESEAAKAFIDAGFMKLGDLAYLRRRLPRTGPGAMSDAPATPTWPSGVRVRSLSELSNQGHTPAEIDSWLSTALEQSYIETRDCPELCGLRQIGDVLESHRAVGIHDPALWWLVTLHDRPVGCMLFAVCPEHQSVELVYLGLGPEIRGQGLGSALLDFGVRRVHAMAVEPAVGALPPEPGHPSVSGSGGLTCAVDTRNAAAMRLYRKAGFERFATRVPMVRRLGTS